MEADLQEARVKKSVGLGGWHWLLLKDSGEEVRLQRNALQVISLPTGQESVSALGDRTPQNASRQSGCLGEVDVCKKVKVWSHEWARSTHEWCLQDFSEDEGDTGDPAGE